MAGMEQLQIHSRSYLLRWINVKGDHIVSWSLQPQKKGINFGLFKHPGSHFAQAPQAPSSSIESGGSPIGESPPLDPEGKDAHPSTAVEKLKSLGYKLVHWHGYCEPNQVTTGTYEVPSGEGGMYALVFDNTFAKSFSKTATLNVLTFPAGGGAPASSHLQVKSNGTKGPDVRRLSGVVKPTMELRPDLNGQSGSQDSNAESQFFSGVLQKHRRKKGQGYARRFFCLDLESATLAYYHDRHSTSIRGIIPLALAAVGANAKTREISVDSGAEVWHLKAGSQKDFEAWKSALETASRPRLETPAQTPMKPTPLSSRTLTSKAWSIDNSLELMRIEDIANRLETVRTTARRVAKDTDPKYFSPRDSPSLSRSESDLQRWDSGSEISTSDAPQVEETAPSNNGRPFWRKKGCSRPPMPGQRSVSTQSQMPSLNSLAISQEDLRKPGRSPTRSPELEGVHDHCTSLLKSLDSIVADMYALLRESKSKRSLPGQLAEAGSRMSMESSFSQEFFDAEAGDTPILTIQHDDDEPQAPSADGIPETADDEGSSSEIEDEEGLEKSNLSEDQAQALFPAKPRNFSLKGYPSIPRRTSVPAPKVMPPSLIGFLRKNVGKDLSTVSMPVSANEPLSLTQKVAELLEYSELLDLAASDSSLGKPERLLYVTAFALSALSSLRVKERAIRKPFNPMLGETFELLREDKGYRFVSEKVSHRPVVLACAADSENWSLAQSPAPTQKFWGKSAELNTEGRVRVTLHTTGENFSWTAATCFLRNIIAGEKYVEPVGTMSVTNESTGQYAVATFKAKGMFSGRSEEVAVQTYDSFGDELPLGLVGKWTHSLTLTESGQAKGKPIWTAIDLPPDAGKAYGFTTFAASLNELSSRDKPHLPPTDSRFRPDQRALEENDVDTAEELKAKLEECQRARRKEMEEAGESWRPQWFTKVANVDGEEVWRMKGGKDNYWEHRARNDWKGVTPVLTI